MKNKHILLIFLIVCPFYIFAPKSSTQNNSVFLIGTIFCAAGLTTIYYFKDKAINFFNSQTSKELLTSIEYTVNQNTRTNTIHLYKNLSDDSLKDVKKSSCPYY